MFFSTCTPPFLADLLCKSSVGRFIRRIIYLHFNASVLAFFVLTRITKPFKERLTYFYGLSRFYFLFYLVRHQHHVIYVYLYKALLFLGMKKSP